ncbi:MAG: hypothetical protein HYS40_05930 [Gemmatimonadetes bacterium]|nr:hypothetical protein [Gemmatimonadota bacterium]
MSQGTLLLLAIVLATVVVGLAAAYSLAQVRPPRSGRRAGRGVAVKISCPLTGDLAGVRLGVDPVSRDLTVLECERFPAGSIQCASPCVPSLRRSREGFATVP